MRAAKLRRRCHWASTRGPGRSRQGHAALPLCMDLGSDRAWITRVGMGFVRDVASAGNLAASHGVEPPAGRGLDGGRADATGEADRGEDADRQQEARETDEPDETEDVAQPQMP